MAEMAYRQLLILNKIPLTRGITIAEIESYLNTQSIECHRRTIQRDLEELSRIFPITVANDQVKPYRWTWLHNAPRFDLPGMTPAMALTFSLAEKMLKKSLPSEVVNMLSSYFDNANKLLQNIDNNYSNWENKVHTISSKLPMLTPALNQDAVNTVYTALLEDKRFTCSYKKSNRQSEVYEISPKGLVFADNIVYVVGTLWKYKDIRQFALHRITKADLLNTPVAKFNKGFNLKKYAEDGHFFFKKSGAKRLTLKLKLHIDMLRILSESPISKNQKISKINDESFELKASVPDNAQIKWWVLSLGENCTVLEPPLFRDKIISTINTMKQNYTT